MKDPLTPAGIEPATFRFVAQHLNHCATGVPKIIIDKTLNFPLNFIIHIATQLLLIPVAVRFKVLACGQFMAGIAGPNPAQGISVRLLGLSCVVQVAVSAKSLSLVQRSPTECGCVVYRPQRRRPGPEAGCRARRKKIVIICYSLLCSKCCC